MNDADFRAEFEPAAQAQLAQAGQARPVAGTVITAPPPEPHSLPAIMANPRKVAVIKATVISCFLGFALGVILIIAGANADGGTTTAGGMSSPGAVPSLIGFLLVVPSMLTPAIMFLVSLMRYSAVQARKYRAWKRTLTPQELLVVKAAEAAALWGVYAAEHRHLVEVTRPRARAVAMSNIYGGRPQDYLNQPYRPPGQ